MKWWQKASDYNFCYWLAWVLIALSPIWFPVWLAKRIYQTANE